MTSERWRTIEDLYHAALQRPSRERDDFLREATADDEDLRREVKSLLSFDSRAGDFLETTALGETVRTLTGDEVSLEGQDEILTLLFDKGTDGESSVPGLRVTSPDGRTRTVELQGTTLILGRAKDNDLSFPEDDGLSREHLKLEWKEDRWTIEDLGSKNGTFVNGLQVKRPQVLQPGDRISASCVTITFITSRPQ
jgi:hypothetical protein